MSIDCFAISTVYGTYTIKRKFILALKLSFIFGIFHVIMPGIGYLAGSSIRIYIEAFDHWITFFILLYIGLRMILEGKKDKNSLTEKKFGADFKTITYLAVATSIDALAVGISFSLIDLPIYQTIIIIGVFAFISSMLGFGIGDLVSKKINFRIQLIGGIILIGIGSKILIEHLYLHYFN